MRPRPGFRLALLFLLLPGAIARAAPPVDFSAARVQGFADAMLGEAVTQARASGAAIAAVQDGRVTFLRGYGWKDKAAGETLDPETTRLRLASNSKTFAATAIAQLARAGRIASLDDTANTYLKRLVLPACGGHAITVWDLLTHRSGFEDRLFNTGTRTPRSIPERADVLQAELPECSHAAGDMPSYNNVSAGVLGVMIEDLTGQTLAQYYQEHIFTPLGMTHTRLHTDPAVDPGLAVSLQFAPGVAPRPAFGAWAENPGFASAGAVDSTAGDMARYMLAQLDAARSGDPLKLGPEGFALLHTRHFGLSPAVSGFGMMFFVYDWGPYHVVEHSGVYPDFRSYMLLLPEQNAGIFIGWAGGRALPSLTDLLPGQGPQQSPEERAARHGVTISLSEMRGRLMAALVGPYAPPRADGRTPASDYAGRYGALRRNRSTIEKLLELLQPPAAESLVAAAGPHQLRIDGRKFEEVSPGVFYHAPDAQMPWTGFSDTIAFLRGADGRVTGYIPYYADDFRQKGVPAWDSPSICGQVLTLGTVLALSTLWAVFWPRPRRRLLPAAAGLAALGVWTVLLWPSADGLGALNLWGLGVRGGMAKAAICANLELVLTLASVVSVVMAWRRADWGRGPWGLLRRAHFTLGAVGAALAAAVLTMFNATLWHMP